jgi:hypothetical protein
MKNALALAFISMLFTSVLVPQVLAAAPPQPSCLFYGYVYVDGALAQDGLTITAVISGATLNWTTQTKSGTYGWPSKGSSLPQGFLIPSMNTDSPYKDGGVDGDAVQFFVQGIKADEVGTFESSAANRLDLTATSGLHVVIDQSFVSHAEANVASVQTVGFHAEWSQDGSDVAQGSIIVGTLWVSSNNRTYITNATGWITFSVTWLDVNKTGWTVTSVNCGGVSNFIQTAPAASIIWNRIKITSGGLTQDSTTTGQTVTVWFRAVYEFDNSAFNNTAGVLYVNDSALTWSTTNNRWEYNFNPTKAGTDTFLVTSASASLSDITAINDITGAVILTVTDQPLIPAALLYGITAMTIIAAISAAIFFAHRKGYRFRVSREPPKNARNQKNMRPKQRALFYCSFGAFRF